MTAIGVRQSWQIEVYPKYQLKVYVAEFRFMYSGKFCISGYLAGIDIIELKTVRLWAFSLNRNMHNYFPNINLSNLYMEGKYKSFILLYARDVFVLKVL